MAHNATVTLTAADKARATKARNVLDAVCENDRVLVHFVKRDGTARYLEGPVLSRVGTADKEAVVVETIEGPRSANLWSIKNVSFL